MPEEVNITPENCLTALTSITKELHRIRACLSEIMSSAYGEELRAWLCTRLGLPIDRCPVEMTGEDVAAGVWGKMRVVIPEYGTESLNDFSRTLSLLKLFFRRHAESRVVTRQKPEHDMPESDEPIQM